MRIVGPSSLGIVNLRNGALLTANAAFDEPDLPVGKIFGASHSGGMIGTLLSRGKACGIGFAGLVSVGNEVDLSLGEICLATLDDPDIDSYLLFLETLRHADKLRVFAERAAAAGRPVLAYKLGRSVAARELALTHTGALAGEDDVADAFLRDCGIARVESLSALIEGLPLLRRVPPRRELRTPRVAVITTTAGGAAMVVDPLASRGIEMGPPSEETYARFDAAGIKVARARLIDLTLVGTRYEVMKAALDILTTAPEFDLVVTVVGSSARFYPDLAVRPIIDSARRGEADRDVPGARGAAGAGRAGQGRRRQFLHAGSLRRRRRRGAVAPAAAAASARARAHGALRRRPTARRTPGLWRARSPRRSARAVGRARHGCADAGVAVRLSGGREGAGGGDLAQVRCRRGRARHRRWRRRSPLPSPPCGRGCHRPNACWCSR